MNTYTVFGATGLIGSYFRKELSDAHLQLAVRNSPEASQVNEKEVLVDFEQLENYPDLFDADAIFCCLGTTIKNVGGDQQKFRHIDMEIPAKIATLAARHGASTLLVVSAMGAHPESKIFYNKVKGEMEEAMKAAGLTSLYIFRPALLMGKRRENRTGEKIAQAIMPVFSPLLGGRLKNYRPIHAKTVAQAMAYFARQPQPGIHTLLSAEIQAAV